MEAGKLTAIQNLDETFETFAPSESKFSTRVPQLTTQSLVLKNLVQQSKLHLSLSLCCCSAFKVSAALQSHNFGVDTPKNYACQVLSCAIQIAQAPMQAVALAWF